MAQKFRVSRGKILQSLRSFRMTVCGGQSLRSFRMTVSGTYARPRAYSITMTG